MGSGLKALAVIDIQPCYMKHYKDTSFLDSFFSSVNLSIAEANKQSIPIVLIEHQFEGWLLKKLSQWFYQSTGIPGTADFPTDPRVKVKPVAKFTKSKSNSFLCQPFADWMKDNRIEELSILGQDGLYCVKQTALGALQKGVRPKIIDAAVASSNMPKWKTESEALKSQGIEFVPSFTAAS